MMQLSPDQSKALKAMVSWYKNWKPEGNQPFFYLGGYAGCGKTTIAEFFENEIAGDPGRIVRCAYTGKAAMRLQQVTGKQASTIHSVAYRLVEEPEQKGKKQEPRFEINTVDSPILGSKLVLLDECSMVNEEMGGDLLSFHKPILVLGDPGQLPPVKGSGFFTKRKPNAMLTEVHRQALDSPIIRVATAIRNGKRLARLDEPDCRVYPFSRDYDFEQELLLADQILTGRNLVRTTVNTKLRELHGFSEPYPQPGDKLICVKNQRQLALFNGVLGTVQHVHSADQHQVLLDIDTELGLRQGVDIMPECFTAMEDVQEMSYRDRREYSEFDWGYCLTVHKSQGSQWDDVLLLDDNFLSWKQAERSKWLYTAVTRAAKKLTVLNWRA